MIGQKGSSLCCCGGCLGFAAFDGSHRFFRYATAYDYDCCYFGVCRDDQGFDGKIKFESTGCGFGLVVESTGNYLNSFPRGQCLDCKGRYPLDSIHQTNVLMRNSLLRCQNYFATKPGVVNPTKATAIINFACCNGDGDKIYWELTEEITDGTCDTMGACCDNAGTCRMCHLCECETEKGEIWHGEGSACGPENPCFCKGFQAFDGSKQWFKYATLIDEDTCYLSGARNDGGVVIEWNEECGCLVSIWNTSVRENSGRVIDVYGAYRALGIYKIDDCVTIPGEHVASSVHNSATFCSLGKSTACGNPEGDKRGWKLSDSISCNLLP